MADISLVELSELPLSFSDFSNSITVTLLYSYLIFLSQLMLSGSYPISFTCKIDFLKLYCRAIPDGGLPNVKLDIHK